MSFILHPGKLSRRDLQLLLHEEIKIELTPEAYQQIHASQQTVTECIAQHQKIYGINTGFGALAHTFIPHDDLMTLQKSLVLSHAAGVGDLLNDKIVRLILILKLNSLAQGFSGVRKETIDLLIKLLNHAIYPCIPAQGSVGASGDLAPLAHLSLLLIGEGHAHYHGKKITAQEAFDILEIQPLTLHPKEGLALLNGTQVSTALAITALFAAENLMQHALLAGALSVDAARGSYAPFDERIQKVRGHLSQIKIAAILRELLNGSEINASHADCSKIQDPYSLRCQPQVMGACLKQMWYADDVLITEANAVSDNPLIFSNDHDILSGGNFHAEPVGFAADALALVFCEMGSLSERRSALLINPEFTHLPPFLIANAGINSGFMIAQVTAAALVSENKSMAFPNSVDSIPTSNNQEDHVSMATHAAHRLLSMSDNLMHIIAIELLLASQAIDFLRPLQTAHLLEIVHQHIRKVVSFYDHDHYLAPDIAHIKQMIEQKCLIKHMNISLLDLD